MNEQQQRLNDFIHNEISNNGIDYVVQNYQMLRNEYYESKSK